MAFTDSRTLQRSEMRECTLDANAAAPFADCVAAVAVELVSPDSSPISDDDDDDDVDADVLLEVDATVEGEKD